jgi:hypothetical protein
MLFNHGKTHGKQSSIPELYVIIMLGIWIEGDRGSLQRPKLRSDPMHCVSRTCQSCTAPSPTRKTTHVTPTPTHPRHAPTLSVTPPAPPTFTSIVTPALSVLTIASAVISPASSELYHLHNIGQLRPHIHSMPRMQESDVLTSAVKQGTGKMETAVRLASSSGLQPSFQLFTKLTWQSNSSNFLA